MSLSAPLRRGLDAETPVSLRLYGLIALLFTALAIPFPEALARGALAAWLLVISAGMGAAILVHTARLTGGRWNRAARPALEGLSASVPFAAALGLPLLILLQPLVFPWAGGHGLPEKPDVAALYLSPLPFSIRALLILAGWSVIAILAAGFGPQVREENVEAGLSERTNEDGEPLASDRLDQNRSDARGRIASGLSIAFYAISVHFAAIDWIMSLEPHWSSTAFGAMFAITQIALALALLVACDAGGADESGGPRDDLSKLLLAALLGLVYLQFMQFLVQWSGNLPEKVAYYVLRSAFPWTAVIGFATLLAAAAFAILSRTALRKAPGPSRLAGDLVLAFVVLFLFFEFAPAFRDDATSIACLAALVLAAALMLSLTLRSIAATRAGDERHATGGTS